MTETINEYRRLQGIVSEILTERARAFLWGHCPEYDGWERTKQGLTRRDEHLVIRETISVAPAQDDFGVQCSHCTALGGSDTLAHSESEARSWGEGVLASII